MPRFALSALGADQPGIVAAVSGALMELGCNLEDSSMTILQGQFAILLVVAAGPSVDRRELEEALDPAAELFDLVVSVRPLPDEGGRTAAPVMWDHDDSEGEGAGVASGSAPPVESWTISVHGADRPGIVHGITAALAAAGGNVADLATHLVGAPEAPVYAMTLRVTLPAGLDAVAAKARVEAAASALGVHCSVHPDVADTL